MDTQQNTSVSTPLEGLSMDDLMGLLIESEMLAHEMQRTIKELRAELLTRVNRGYPYDHVVPDPHGGEMGYTVSVYRVKGAHRWKYNPKWVENKLEEMAIPGYTKRVLDTKTFNSALTNNDSFREQFDDHVRSEFDKDKLMVKGIDRLIKVKGL